MKLGLFAVFAIFSQLLAEDFYMFSVFMLGIDVGQAEPYPNVDAKTLKKKPFIKKLMGGKVRFRAILFSSSGKPARENPRHEDFDWEIYYVTDFELDFALLKRDFLKNFFKDFSFQASINTAAISSRRPYYKEIKGSSFKVKVSKVDFDTEGTHVISLLTDSYMTNDVGFSVSYDYELQFYFFFGSNVLQKSLFNFKISDNFKKTDWCSPSEQKSKFKMESITLKKKKEKDSGQKKDGTFEIKTTLTKGKNVQKYIPFKLSGSEKIANVILVVNSIPLRRIHKNPYLGLTISYDIPFDVKSVDFTYYNNLGPDPLDGGTLNWEVLNAKKELFAESSYPDKDLISKWKKFDEPISVTFHFSCPIELI